MPSAVSGRQCPAESPAKKTSPSVGRPELVRDPVALVADRLTLEVGGQPQGRLLHVMARVERADADPHLVPGREAPAVAGGDVVAVDPDLELVRRSPRMNLEPAGQRRVGRLEAAVPGEDPPPAERVDDERRGDLAAVGDDDVVVSVGPPAFHLRGFKLRVALLPHQPAQLPVVERRERPGKPHPHGRVGGVDHEGAEGLADRALEPRFESHSVGAAQADVCRSPIS